jgi:hypothetical protein
VAFRKRAGLHKIGEALMSLGESRGDALAGASKLSLYSYESHVLKLARRDEETPLATPPEARRAS